MVWKIRAKRGEGQYLSSKMHLYTSNEAWKKVTNPNRSQSAEALTEDFYKKNQISEKSAVPVIEIEKKTLPQALVEQWTTKIKIQKRTIL